MFFRRLNIDNIVEIIIENFNFIVLTYQILQQPYQVGRLAIIDEETEA